MTPKVNIFFTFLCPRYTKSINYQDTDSDCHLLLSELIWSPSSNDFCPPCFEIPSRSLVCQDGMTYAWTQWLDYEKLLHIWPLMFIHFLIYVCIFVCVHSSVEITLRHSKEREDRREKEEKKNQDLDVQADGARVWDMVSWVVKFPKEECIYTKYTK